MKKKEKKYKDKFNAFLDFLIAENDLSGKKDAIYKISEILFDRFDEEWKKKNQKFDFSFSFGSESKTGLRFSYNDFGERKDFKKKLASIFDIFPGVYDKDIFMKVMDCFEFFGKKHQTTFGIEWLQGKKRPRIKIYFEELFNYYSGRKIINQGIALTKILDQKIYFNKTDNIGAFCVDFMDDGGTDFKVYFLYKEKNEEMIDKIKQNISLFLGSKNIFLLFQRIFLLEKNCFYYVTHRLQSGFIFSIKFYKIYEVFKISNFENSFKEIMTFLKLSKKGGDLAFFKKIIIFSVKNKAYLYPVISSIDIRFEEYKYDVYFSLK